MTGEDCLDLETGIEVFVVDVHGEEEVDGQCGRCGSSLAVEEDFFNEQPNAIWRCLSSPEWCETHPLPGREHVRTARGRWPSPSSSNGKEGT